MKNILNKWSFILSVLIIIFLVIREIQTKDDLKIGVVQMDDLVYGFDGMKEASADYSEKMEEWKNQMDSIQSDLESLYQEIKMDSINKNETKLQQDLQKFSLLKNSYLSYQQKIQEKASQDDQNMTSGILAQVNGYIKDYAEENGFDLIICNTQIGNVGYVKNYIDVTDDLLKYANAKYNDEE